MNAKTINFFCEWSNYPGLQLSQMEALNGDSKQKLMVSMCQGRISPELILQAFSKGAWGVLISCCPPEECDHNGNYKTQRRVLMTQKVLEQMGINPERLRLERVSKGDAGTFKKVLKEFNEVIEKMGPI